MCLPWIKSLLLWWDPRLHPSDGNVRRSWRVHLVSKTTSSNTEEPPTVPASCGRGSRGRQGTRPGDKDLDARSHALCPSGSDTVTRGRRGRTLGWNTGEHRRLWPKALSGRGQG